MTSQAHTDVLEDSKRPPPTRVAPQPTARSEDLVSEVNERLRDAVSRGAGYRAAAGFHVDTCPECCRTPKLFIHPFVITQQYAH